MRRDVIESAGRHKKVIFPVFTNGTLMQEGCLTLFSENRNLLPVLSIEGGKEQTDARREAESIKGSDRPWEV